MWIKSNNSGSSPRMRKRIRVPEAHSASVIDWLNLDTGAEMSLVSFGQENTGGEFNLWYAAPGATTITDLTDLLSAATTITFLDDPESWRVVQVRCAEVVDRVLNVVEFVPVTPPWNRGSVTGGARVG